ncbi:hypothetical protein FB45DRAFT_1002503 [Roridomyces roridus]|uniref:Aminoglycoside phosphotransferase domain-containing protein n=1 Tax=Roridomyces roridus TaxID=1738132 RepID=A0AAD7FSK1_9AGAR|nr:hypothetical protein FB45DRAFT_1002503 [Roridomyces roridus]
MVLPSHETLVSRSLPPSPGAGGYKYYLICVILSSFVGTLVFFKFRHDRANEAAVAERERRERQVQQNQPRPRFFDVYVDKPGTGWEWEAMTPLTVSSLDASTAQTSEGDDVPARARVAVLLHMPGPRSMLGTPPTALSLSCAVINVGLESAAIGGAGSLSRVDRAGLSFLSPATIVALPPLPFVGRAFIICFHMTDKSGHVPSLPPSPTLDSPLAALTDADIIARCFGPERQSLPDADHPDSEHIAVITKDTVGKFEDHGEIEDTVTYPIEAFALEVLAQHTTIPVPRVHCLAQTDYGHIIVMDRISGKQLSTLWPTMSVEEKNGIADTLAGYLRQLRSVQIPHLRVPGPLDREMRPRLCIEGPVFGFIGPPRGPFASYAELTEFLEHKRKGLMDPSIPPMDDSYPLVLTHHDIRPHNLILDDAGTLWMVDWAGAGVYPE